MPDVLVVEDDRVVLRAVAGLCRSEGLRVDETVSVEEAVAKLHETSYRLAIVDLMLPEQSGFHLLRAVGAARRSPSMVMISGYATIENALECFRLGAFDFLPKPFDVAELVGVVRRALRQADRRAADLGEHARAAGEQRYFLGRHSWAVLDADGTATLGAAETFPGALGDVSRVELPAAGGHVNQGQEIARLEGAEEVHRIWSPLGGLVVAVNDELAAAVDLIDRSPFSAAWLARIVPADLQNELRVLTRRAAGRAALAGGG